MKRNRIRKAAKKAVLTATMALAAAGVLQASVVSDPVTASKWTLAPGANTLSAPAHGTPVFSGEVSSVSGDVVTIAASLTAGSLDKIDIDLLDASDDDGGPGPYSYQYVLVVRNDLSADGDGTQGDWWTVESNTASTVTVTPQGGFGSTASRIAAGDTVEVYKLKSLKDIFGSGPAFGNDLKITIDQDFDDVTSGDSINFFGPAGSLGSAATIFYHNGSLTTEGYYVDSFYNVGDGSAITFTPDQAFRVNRNFGAAFDITLTGVLQAYNLSHYVVPGLNPVATGYAAPAFIEGSGLFESGFAAESNFDDSADAVYRFFGLGFDRTWFYHDGSLTTAGWWEDSFAQPTVTPLDPVFGFFVKSTAGTYIWRQPTPFVP